MRVLESIPGGARLQRSAVWKKMRHRMSMLLDRRANSGFTGFLRLPTQFEALAGPVATLLRPVTGPLRITVLGYANGAEAFTVASVLKRYHPHLAFQVRGYDVDSGCAARARQARYAADEVFNNEVITDEFVEGTFDREGSEYVVKPSIVERVEFHVGDALDPALPAQIGTCDIVFAQNFIFHMSRHVARMALRNVVRLLRPGAVLFADGVDLDVRHKFVRQTGLKPLDYKIATIHDEARRARAVGWPYHYWGLEPLMTHPRDWKRRYATVYVAP